MTSARPHPNLFIVGSMKSGTTILYDFLTEYPWIIGARGKEVHYFSLHEDKGVDWYLDHFAEESDAVYALDASPTYLDMAADDTIPEKIKAFSPDARIIIMIREPVERAISQFKHLKHVNHLPDIQNMSFSQLVNGDWDEALDHAQLERTRELVLGFSYYSDKIARYAKIFGKDRVLVIHNDDLRHHGTPVMRSVFAFLELDFPNAADFARQRYVRQTARNKEDQTLLLALATQYSKDYWAACRAPGVTRPAAPEGGPVLNMPVGGRYEEVSVGRDGYLFLTDGSNSPIAMFHDIETDTDDPISQWHMVTRRRKTQLSNMGIEFYQCMVPEKLSILGEKLNWSLECDKSYASRFYAQAPKDIRDNIIHIYDFFTNSPHRDDLYLKTDSHWSHIGAFGAYQNICCHLGVAFRADLLGRPFGASDVLFDLGSKLPEPIREHARFYSFRQEAEVVTEGRMVQFKRRHNRENDSGLHVGSFMHYANALAPDPRRVLLFGDSFSEYRDHLLTGLMSETFSELIFVWGTSIDYKLIEEYSPNVVLCVMTERFMTRVPDDNFDLSAYVDAKLGPVPG